MHLEILSPNQLDMFALLKAARKRSFYMVGGTAIALHLGHRKSNRRLAISRVQVVDLRAYDHHIR